MKIKSKYTILHVSTKLEQKKGEMQKMKRMQIPLKGMGSGLERAYPKKIFFYYYWLQYQKT